eukprot:SAG11_NODE_1657_length_4501_cov_2.957065_2_plen_102_part_00
MCAGLEFQRALATLDVCCMPAAAGGYSHDINPEPSGGWAERNLGGGAAGMTADEMMEYRGRGNGVFIRATQAPHSAAPDPSMLEKCTVAKWSRQADTKATL